MKFQNEPAMSMIFQFRMLSDEDENFIRDYEVPYDATLQDLHRLICEDLEYDADEMASFFLSDAQWQKRREFTLADMGETGPEAPVPMEKAMLGQIIREKHERLLFVFDLFEDRAYFLELMQCKKQEPGLEYPRVAFSHGNPPDQFDSSAAPSGRSLFDEAMDDFSDFEGNDTYDDEY